METYLVSRSENVKVAEKELNKEINQLKNEVEEAEMLLDRSIRPLSSVSSPMSFDYFRKEREIALNNMIHLDTSRTVKNQGAVMIEELQVNNKMECTEASIPLLLHQFFLDQTDELIHYKHLHMLRWRRFCEHSDTIEKLFSNYGERLDRINEDFQDFKNRADRLSIAHHSFVMGDKKAFPSVQPEDLEVFFNWTVSHLHATKKISSFIKLLQWLPLIHKDKIGLNFGGSSKSTTDGDHSGRASSYRSLKLGSEYQLSPSKSGQVDPPPSTGLSVSTEMAFTGLVSDEPTFSLPVHQLDLSSFRELLEGFTIEFKIPSRNELVTSADEMELFGAVNRRFKVLFNKQQECNTFFQYDNIPIGQEHWGVDSAAHSLLKPCTWVEFNEIKPRNDPHQLKQLP